MNLDTGSWKFFYLKDFYIVKMGNGFDKNKMTYDNISVNFVSRVSYNNGVDCKVDLVEGVEPYPAGLLTVALGGSYLGSCFVQEEPFYTGQNVAVLRTKNADMNEYVNLFITTLVRFESKIKYYAFGRELNTHIGRDFSISLPVKHNEDGSILIDDRREYSEEGYVPDWGFMEAYIKSLHYKPLTTKNKSVQIPDLNVNEWKGFSIIDLFKIKRGKINSLNEIETGNVPIVSASGDNEGISFYGNVLAPYCNNITISMNGVNTGFTAYHGYDFNINADCCVLIQKFDMNAYIGVFIATIIGMLRCKYSYGRKMTAERISTETIRLPIQHNPDGTPFIDDTHTYSEEGYIPDWQWMEDYIKSLPYGDRL